MSTALRRADIVVPKQLLDVPNVHSIFRQMRRKRMTQSMERGGFDNACPLACFRKDPFGETLRQMISSLFTWEQSFL